MQSIKEIEDSYKNPDPWQFQTTLDDAIRKQKIIQACIDTKKQYQCALEIGAGEGWITKDLPARRLHGLEISENARQRMPKNVFPRKIIEPYEKFDLMVVPGVLYQHYDCERFFEIIRDHASEIVVTCNIKTWEHKNMDDSNWLRQVLGIEEIHEEEFPYREFTQKLRVFRVIA